MLLRRIVNDKWTVEEFEIDSTELAQKFVVLSGTPDAPANVALDIQGGTSQKYLIDFQTIGLNVSWAGLGLDVQIGLGDFLRVTYIKKGTT